MKLSEKILQLDENLNQKIKKELFWQKGHSENMVINDWLGWVVIWPDWSLGSLLTRLSSYQTGLGSNLIKLVSYLTTIRESDLVSFCFLMS